MKLKAVIGGFDGISCGQVALERAGVEYDTYYASEIDTHAIKVTQNRFPDTVQVGSITEWRNWDIDKDDVELIIGGSPCQGFSMAGSNLVSAQNRKRLYWTNIPDVVLPEDQNISLSSILEIPAGEGITVRPKSKCLRVGGRQSYDRHEWDSIDNTHSRKFTVLECERLQTLPDNYTEGISNTQRYKTLGNGWTVDVIAHIFGFMQ